MNLSMEMIYHYLKLLHPVLVATHVDQGEKSYLTQDEKWP